MNKKDEILAHIREKLADNPEDVVDETTSLFKDRILDSLNLINLISFLESKYQIKISPSEVTLENLDNVSNMVRFIDGKQA